MRFTVRTSRVLCIVCSLFAVLWMTGCDKSRIRAETRVETVEVPVEKFVPLDETLIEHRDPGPLPPPECKDGGKGVSCVAQLIDWLEDEWCPVVRAHNCDKALIRCTQPVNGKPADPGTLMRCITKAGANECSAPCFVRQ
jgi:hypothetical protein